MERRLIVEYERLIAEIERNLRADNLAIAVELASLPATIRGYGHVKQKNLAAAKARESVLLAKLREPQVRAEPLAA